MLYRQVPGGKPAEGDKYVAAEADSSISVKRLGSDNYSVFLPWKYLPGKKMPAPGVTMPFNVSFRRQKGHSFQMLTFEPDLKYLNERSTWMSGRGKLSF